MRIALVTAYFYPATTGGTEKYVLKLAKNLISEDNEVHVITIGDSVSNEYQGIRILSVPDELSGDAEILSGLKASGNLEDFKKLIYHYQYDLIHFHTLTPALNTFHITEAKKMGSQVHFSAHVPGITCIHGDLMQFGQKECDGLIKKQKCTACYISKKNINKPVSQLLSSVITSIGFPGNIASAVNRKRDSILVLNQFCDKIYLFTNWQKEIFIANGFDPIKLSLTSQLLDKKLVPKSTEHRTIRNIGFVGRISHEKGLDILINSFMAANRNDLQLHIAGIVNGISYFEKLKNSTLGNPNIYWETNLSPEGINKFYQKIDLLVIPSITYETGPFVLFEALEHHIPVLANNLGDMHIWKSKGFDITLYNNTKHLTKEISEL